MTSNDEIKKALECCSNQMFSCTDKQCKAKTLGNALDLINQYEERIKFAEKINHLQMEELQSLKEKNKVLANELANFLQVAENKKATKNSCYYKKQPKRVANVETAKAEAIKEFEEKQKEKCKQCVGCFTDTQKAKAIKEFAERLKEKYSQADILCPRRIISLTENELNNLLKEMGVE